MFESDSYVHEVDAARLAPELLSSWVSADIATALMEYLWTASTGGQYEWQEDPCAAAVDVIRFLALARIVAETLNTADGSGEVSWEDLNLNPLCIPPLVTGFLACERGLPLYPDMELVHLLRELGSDSEREVLNSLSTTINESEFFMAVWGAHLGITSFPPSIEDMDEFGLDMSTVSSDTGRTFEYISEMWR